jgi:hypothetical protein
MLNEPGISALEIESHRAVARLHAVAKRSPDAQVVYCGRKTNMPWSFYRRSVLGTLSERGRQEPKGSSR